MTFKACESNKLERMPHPASTVPALTQCAKKNLVRTIKPFKQGTDRAERELVQAHEVLTFLVHWTGPAEQNMCEHRINDAGHILLEAIIDHLHNPLCP